MKRILPLSALLLGVVLIATQCTSKEGELHKKLKNMALELNKMGSSELDDHTRFDSAGVSPQNVFRYYYTVKNTNNPKELFDSTRVNIERKLGEAFSLNPDLQIFKENKLTIEYVYKDEGGNTVETIKMTPDKYK